MTEQNDLSAVTPGILAPPLKLNYTPLPVSPHLKRLAETCHYDQEPEVKPHEGPGLGDDEDDAAEVPDRVPGEERPEGYGTRTAR